MPNSVNAFDKRLRAVVAAYALKTKEINRFYKTLRALPGKGYRHYAASQWGTIYTLLDRVAADLKTKHEEGLKQARQALLSYLNAVLEAALPVLQREIRAAIQAIEVGPSSGSSAAQLRQPRMALRPILQAYEALYRGLGWPTTELDSFSHHLASRGGVLQNLHKNIPEHARVLEGFDVVQNRLRALRTQFDAGQLSGVQAGAQMDEVLWRKVPSADTYLHKFKVGRLP
ncbi:hypothetical protein JCM10908_002682 [Rhodotorula pacifica]|uniref:uncharacterized protein n=1 Tax=Rhodotorula pacifica TaxID=1495444 RepID=UPI003171750E